MLSEQDATQWVEVDVGMCEIMINSHNPVPTPESVFSLFLPSLNAAVRPHPLSVLLPEDGRPREAVHGAGQVDVASDGEPSPDGG